METETDLEAFQQLPPEAKGEQRKTPQVPWKKWGKRGENVEKMGSEQNENRSFTSFEGYFFGG
jgi:hypothetical protein